MGSEVADGVHGILHCSRCSAAIYLGVLKTPYEDCVGFFQRADSALLNWQNKPLVLAMWKFLAEHTTHAVLVLLSTNGPEPSKGSIITDIDIESYIAGWPLPRRKD